MCSSQTSSPFLSWVYCHGHRFYSFYSVKSCWKRSIKRRFVGTRVRIVCVIPRHTVGIMPRIADWYPVRCKWLWRCPYFRIWWTWRRRRNCGMPGCVPVTNILTSTVTTEVKCTSKHEKTAALLHQSLRYN